MLAELKGLGIMALAAVGTWLGGIWADGGFNVDVWLSVCVAIALANTYQKKPTP